MLFNKEAFVFGSQVTTPINREFELVAFSDSVFKNLDTLGIWQAYELAVDDTLQAVDKGFINHIVQELQIVGTIVERPFNAVLDKLLSDIHIVFDIVECHFRLNHPEFGQVTRCIRVFGTESRPKSIDIAQRSSAKFTL